MKIYNWTNSLVDVTNDYDFTNSNSKISELINDVNSRGPQVQFVRNSDDIWRFMRCKTQDLRTIVPVIFHDTENDNYLAHELLHAKCSYIIDIPAIVRSIKEEAANHTFGPRIFDIDGISGMLNNFEHIVMFPLYNDLGFDPNQFVGDNAEDVKEISDLTCSLAKQGLNGNNIGDYLSCAFSFMLYHDNNEWVPEIQNLHKANPELFSIFNKIRNGLHSLDLNSCTTSTAMQLFNSFTRELCVYLNSMFS